jgi:hypothetical protein
MNLAMFNKDDARFGLPGVKAAGIAVIAACLLWLAEPG